MGLEFYEHEDQKAKRMDNAFIGRPVSWNCEERGFVVVTILKRPHKMKKNINNKSHHVSILRTG